MIFLWCTAHLENMLGHVRYSLFILFADLPPRVQNRDGYRFANPMLGRRGDQRSFGRLSAFVPRRRVGLIFFF